MKKRRRNTARRMSELPRSDPSGSAAAIAGPGVPEMSVFAYTEDALEEKHGIPVDEIPAYRDFPGTVWINESQHLSPLAAFGGQKQSGLGVEGELWTLDLGARKKD